MPLDVWIATSYVIEFVQSLFILNGEIFRVIAENGTLVDKSIEGMYYLFGFLEYFSDFFRDFTNVVSSNNTTMDYSVLVWQKVAGNATYVFGDYEANYGIAYIWRKGYECIQPGNYCEGLAPATTYEALEFLKWMFTAMAEIGRNFSVVFT